MISPICISTVTGKGLAVLLESIKQYCPDIPVYLRGPESVIEHLHADVKVFAQATNFGDDYNAIINRALEDFDSVVVANDDIVLTPTSYKTLLEDVKQLKDETADPVGWVSARCDAARPQQNIRTNLYDEELHYFKYPCEDCIVQMPVLSPIFGWIERDAWECFKFPPLNWFSDDVHCEDLRQAGFTHYLSRSYVHHIGSQTIGLDGERLTQQAMPWLRKNRPHYSEVWFK